MDMHDTRISRGKKTLQLDDCNLGFKYGNDVDRDLGTTEDKTDADIFFFDTLEAETNLIAGRGNGHFLICFGVYAKDLDA